MYYVTHENGFYILRQERYKSLLKGGQEHPHDVCGVAPTIAKMREIGTILKGDIDYSLVESLAIQDDVAESTVPTLYDRQLDGPWQIPHTDDMFWYIYNTITRKYKRIGPVRTSGINYHDRAVAEAKRRNLVIKERAQRKET